MSEDSTRTFIAIVLICTVCAIAIGTGLAIVLPAITVNEKLLAAGGIVITNVIHFGSKVIDRFFPSAPNPKTP